MLLPQYEKIQNFLVKQKERMLMQDGASKESGWLTEREQQGIDFVAEDKDTGKRIGLHEMLYNNTISWLVHASRKGLRQEFIDLSQGGVLNEDTTTSKIATFTTAMLPAIRRIFANLIAMDFVSVQPMAGPTGILYWMDFKYVTTHAADGITAGDRVDLRQGAETYDDSGEKGTIRELEAGLSSKTIETETKKVATRWTQEAEQDFSSQWKLNLESEMIPELGNSIVREVNRKLLAAMENGVQNNVNWSKTVPATDTTSTDKMSYYQTLWHSIQLANSKIVAAKYQPATYLIMNADTYYYLERLNNFKADPNVGESGSTFTRYVGTLSGLYKVYVDPWFTANKIMLGYKGATWKDAVAYYCPYIPLFLSDKYIYNNDFTQFIRGAMTRYAYGVIPTTSTQSPVKNAGLATVTLTGS